MEVNVLATPCTVHSWECVHGMLPGRVGGASLGIPTCPWKDFWGTLIFRI